MKKLLIGGGVILAVLGLVYSLRGKFRRVVVAPKPETTEACILPMTAPTPAPAPKPAPAPVPAAAAQWKLKCFHLKTLRARIDCRLALPHDQLEKEIAAKYLPEECRSKPVKQQAACVQLYKNFGPCWDREGVSPRMECAREVIGMSSENIVDLYRECKDLKSKEKTACLATQREKLFVYAKFKFYDLSEYAEEYLEDGIVTRKAAVDFVTQMETKKQQFNKAGNNFARRLAIAKEVRATWGAFMKKVNLGAVAGDPVARAELYQAMDVEMGQTLAQLLDLK